jgi:pectate lyase
MRLQLSLRLGALLVCSGGCSMAAAGCARYDYDLGGLPASRSGGASNAGEPDAGGAQGGAGGAQGGAGGAGGTLGVAGDLGSAGTAGETSVDCSAIAAHGNWELCDSGPDFCAAVFTDRAGCAAVCASVGLVCTEVWEDVDGVCAPDTGLPVLTCDPATDHDSDYCLCTDDGTPAGSGGAQGSGGSGSGGDTGFGGNGTGGDEGVGGSGGDGGSGGSGTGGQEDCPMDLQGWATISGDGVSTTTGGGDLAPVRPTSEQELMDYAGDGSARVIEIEGTFNIPRLRVVSNKTLIGIGPNAAINGGISIRGYIDDNVSNVILRNLNVNGSPSDADGDAVQIYFAHHVWVDHCEIWDGVDANLDVVHASNWVTISWTIFRYTSAAPAPDHKFSNLFGHSDDNAAEDQGRLNISVHHNWWEEGIIDHMPRVRFGQVHIYNNYYSSSGNGSCIRAGTNAHILSESNYFYQVAQPHGFNSEEDQGTSHITARNNVYEGTTGSNETGGGGTPFDTPPYSAPIDNANEVPGLVQVCAGPQ